MSLAFPLSIWMAFPNLKFPPPVFCNNRLYLLSLTDLCHPIFESLACKPLGQQLPVTTTELHSLVKDTRVRCMPKILPCERSLRRCSRKDESGLRLVHGDKPLKQVRNLYFRVLRIFFWHVSSDKYALQLSTLVLEQSLILVEISCKLTLEAKGWDRLPDY